MWEISDMNIELAEIVEYSKAFTFGSVAETENVEICAVSHTHE